MIIIYPPGRQVTLFRFVWKTNKKTRHCVSSSAMLSLSVSFVFLWANPFFFFFLFWGRGCVWQPPLFLPPQTQHKDGSVVTSPFWRIIVYAASFLIHLRNQMKQNRKGRKAKEKTPYYIIYYVRLSLFPRHIVIGWYLLLLPRAVIFFF